MEKYIGKSNTSGNVQLFQSDKEIGELVYQNWYSYKAEILLANGHSFQLEPKGIWNSKIEVICNGETLLFFEMSWSGIVIHATKNNQPVKLLLKLKGWLSSDYLLVDEHSAEILKVNCNLKWNLRNPDFEIEAHQNLQDFDRPELLIFTVLHSINYNIAFMNGY